MFFLQAVFFTGFNTSAIELSPLVSDSLAALACSGVVDFIVFVVGVVVVIVPAAAAFVAVFCYIFVSRVLGFLF